MVTRLLFTGAGLTARDRGFQWPEKPIRALGTFIS